MKGDSATPMLKRRTGIILALDAPSKMTALQLLKQVSRNIDAVKIGYQLILGEGLNIIGLVRREYPNLPIIADLKIMDAPHIATKMVSLAIEAGCDLVTVCGQCGPTVISDCIQVARKRGGDIILFVEFTQPNGLIGTDQANKAALLAREKGAYGILAPGTKPKRIKELRSTIGSDLVMISCGVGAQGPEPGSAIMAGANFEIIGRAIYDAAHPQLAASNIAKKLSTIV